MLFLLYNALLAIELRWKRMTNESKYIINSRPQAFSNKTWYILLKFYKIGKKLIYCIILTLVASPQQNYGHFQKSESNHQGRFDLLTLCTRARYPLSNKINTFLMLLKDEIYAFRFSRKQLINENSFPNISSIGPLVLEELEYKQANK